MSVSPIVTGGFGTFAGRRYVPTLGFGTGVGGDIKAWDGASWTAYPIKVWDGAAWVVKPLKYWDGAAWVETPY